MERRDLRPYKETVLRAHQEGVPLWQMKKVLGDRVLAKTVIRSLRNQGLLPQANAESNQGPEEQQSFKKNGEQAQLIRPYLDMGMTAAEMQEAILLEKGIELGTIQARHATNTARRRGKARQLTDEEREDSSRNSHLPWAEVKDGIHLWVGAKRLAEDAGLDTSSWTRLDWKKWIKEHEEDSRINASELESQVSNKIADRVRNEQRIIGIFKQRGISDEDANNFLNGSLRKLDENQKNLTLLARELVESGIVQESPVVWNFAKQLATKYEKDWFESLPEALVMEGYITAVAREWMGHRSIIREYFRIGKSIDQRWFESDRMAVERGFVKYKARQLVEIYGSSV